MTADILIAPRDDAAIAVEAHHWPAYWASEIAPYLGAEIAEIGAGLAPAALRLNTAATRWICVEPDRRIARRLTHRAQRGELGQRCGVLNGWVVDLPQTEPFDTILYINTIEYIPADRAELEAAAKRLRRGGHLIVLSEAHPFLYSAQDAALGRVRRYTRRTMLSIEPQGFQSLALRYLDSAGYAAATAARVLPAKAMPDAERIALWSDRQTPRSRMLDRVTRYRFGKSLLAVWRRMA